MQNRNYASIAAMPPAQRLEEMSQMTRAARRLSLMGQRIRHPDLIGDRWGRHIVRLWLGQEFEPGGKEMNWIQDSLGLAQQLHPILEAVGIPYFITGGVAGAAWGEPRTTRDLDIVIQVQGSRDRLIVALETAGYLVAGGDSSVIQITHQTEITTADLIVSADDEWDRERFATRCLVGGLWLSSPECLILAKLKWGRGNSEKQQRDIEGILRAGNVDRDYLRHWAAKLGIASLLEDSFS